MHKVLETVVSMCKGLLYIPVIVLQGVVCTLFMALFGLLLIPLVLERVGGSDNLMAAFNWLDDKLRYPLEGPWGL